MLADLVWFLSDLVLSRHRKGVRGIVPDRKAAAEDRAARDERAAEIRDWRADQKREAKRWR
jgi:hypothetical protein